jgi:hypothetical protein
MINKRKFLQKKLTVNIKTGGKLMFYELQSRESQNRYKEMLEATGALSKLSSESNVPYLGYRMAENIFCEAFKADNLSRSDCSADAAKDKIGVGIKTFLNQNGRTMQKVAEFNKDIERYRGKTPREVVEIISNLRNERLNVTKRIHGLDELIYHCIVREEGKIMVFECTMDTINLDEIKNINVTLANTITFEDDKNKYAFNISKSTLYKRFITENVLLEVRINIIENIFDIVMKFVKSEFGGKLKSAPIFKEKEHICLPLFSDKGGRHVPEKSGLNQWNAKGRTRDKNEIYIPIPVWIHNTFPGFLPSRDKPFTLKLPNGEGLSCKVCQDGGKALMSNPNLALGKWLLRDIMGLKDGELLTHEKLENLGLDSIILYKINDDVYSINFTETGSYDKFYEDHKI